ncbi:aminotransferase class III-fold pyridoxal phosphate-dependent enzyme [Pseudomonas sp. MWU16-30317]|uniref:aminotransferase class III-fold pyridoxal phosphate-dependent enzyme n=1 Tax=Pseudomonas sp. MWU16-30317 TaxID=2878095 RepID=UPI001CFC1129|nr:aminotransferase class III-fold pyridoxal phosphate-dependent enzyme [Pseudomonas sp. MWU16-30317]
MTDSPLLGKHRHVLMPWSVQVNQGETLIVGGDGPYFIKAGGGRILDFSSGWAATQLGHGHPIVLEAIREQLDKICWAPPNFVVDVRAQYAAALSDLSPWEEGCRVHFTTGGGEANDDAVRIARQLTGRSKILAAYRSYHGNTQGAAALTGSLRRWASEPNLPGGVVRFWAPHPYRSPFYTDDPTEETRRALDHVDRVLTQEGPENVAALIIEPVLGSEGVVVYPEGYLAGLRALTSRHGILLIFDEVVTGFGRVGELFAASRFGVNPDLLTFAKGSSSGYVPLGGVLVREGLACEFDGRLFDAGHTHSGHPLAMAAGLGTLKALQSENLFKKAYEIESWMKVALGKLAVKHEIIGDFRGLGAYFAIELVKDRTTREPVVAWQAKDSRITKDFYRDLLNDGLWLHGKYSISVLAPALIISEGQFAEGMEKLDRALAKLSDRIQA